MASNVLLKRTTYYFHSDCYPEKLSDRVCIGAFSFAGVDWIREITLPEGIRSIGDAAFSECKELRYVNLPQSLEKLEGFIFVGSTKLKKIYLPRNVKEFADDSIFRTGYLKVILENNSAARDY